MRGAANGSFEPSLPFLFNAADVCFKEDAETVAKLVQVSTRVGARVLFGDDDEPYYL